MTSRLQLRDVTVHLRGAPVLTGLDVDGVTGQCRAVVGLNGAGKSTTLRVALGMLTPSAPPVVPARGGEGRRWATMGAPPICGADAAGDGCPSLSTTCDATRSASRS